MMDLLGSLPPGAEPATDVVTRKVLIEGAEIGGEILLSQITVNKSFNKVTFAKLVFLDGSASKQDFELSNDTKFKPGNKIKIQLGYHGEVETVFEGIIIKHGIKVSQQGSSLLMIEAKDKIIKLTAPRKSAYYINKTDSTIISDLAVGINSVVDSTSITHKQLVQFDATDWDFILTRAEANGMLVFCDDGKLVVKKPAMDSPPVMEAKYGKNIWEFEAEMDARKQIKDVTSLSWDYTKQELEKSQTGTTVFTDNGNFSSQDLGAVIGASVKLNHAGHLTKPQLQSWSDATAMRSKLSKAVGRVRVVGTSKVKPGTVIKLSGVGDRFNGNVFVTGVLHHFEGLWQTDIQFGWDEEWFYKKENIMDKPASGLLPGVNGLLIGIVQDVNDTIDGGQYRVKVHIPTITNGNEGIWARVATLDAGDERGVYFRPQTKDEVVLGFLNDDPREAIILGYLHSKSSHKSALPVTANSLEYGFVTKEKTKLIFDDTNKRMTLSVKTATGEKTIILNDTSNAIELKDENSNSIKMDATGITIQAGTGKNVIIKGTQVLIN